MGPNFLNRIPHDMFGDCDLSLLCPANSLFEDLVIK